MESIIRYHQTSSLSRDLYSCEFFEDEDVLIAKRLWGVSVAIIMLLNLLTSEVVENIYAYFL